MLIIICSDQRSVCEFVYFHSHTLSKTSAARVCTICHRVQVTWLFIYLIWTVWSTQKNTFLDIQSVTPKVSLSWGHNGCTSCDPKVKITRADDRRLCFLPLLTGTGLSFNAGPTFPHLLVGHLSHKSQLLCLHIFHTAAGLASI